MDFHMKNHLPSIIIHLSNSFSKTISSSSLLHFQSALLVVLSLSFCTPRSRLCWLRKLRSASCRGTALSLTCDAIHHGIVKANLSCSCRLLRELTLVPLVLWGLGSLQSPSCQNHRLVGLDWKEFTVSPQERKKKKHSISEKNVLKMTWKTIDTILKCPSGSKPLVILVTSGFMITCTHFGYVTPPHLAPGFLACFFSQVSNSVDLATMALIIQGWDAFFWGGVWQFLPLDIQIPPQEKVWMAYFRGPTTFSAGVWMSLVHTLFLHLLLDMASFAQDWDEVDWCSRSMRVTKTDDHRRDPHKSGKSYDAEKTLRMTGWFLKNLEGVLTSFYCHCYLLSLYNFCNFLLLQGFFHGHHGVT